MGNGAKMLPRNDTTTASHVVLTPLSPTTWRVCDDRFDAGELRQVVGYLHVVGPEFEMLWMRPHPGVVYRYPTMEAALAAISVRLELTSDVR
jgi:hypothetical protein